MHLCTRRLAVTVALAVTALAGVFASVASAGHFSISNQRFSIEFASVEVFSFSPVVRCRMTLEGRFTERTMAKVRETQIGTITSARIAHPCTGGEMWVFNGSEVLHTRTLATSLPWTMTYRSFLGTLPNISQATLFLLRPRFLVEAFYLGTLVTCEFVGINGPDGPPTVTLRRSGTNRITELLLIADLEPGMPSACPEPRLTGTGPYVSPEGAGVFLTLI